jgi:RNA polymerase sigma-70 factor (ECF subfamily)
MADFSHGRQQDQAPLSVGSASPLDERELIERCRSGDDDAFAELVDRYKKLVYALVSRMVPDRAQADDLAQEVFVKVHRGLPYFRGDARLSTWIYRIVSNVCLQARAAGTRVPAAVAAVVERGAPDSAFATLELRDRLERAMAQLPENYRLLVAAHYLQGVQYEALAEALDIPIGTVKTHLHRAKRRLRELMS